MRDLYMRRGLGAAMALVLFAATFFAWAPAAFAGTTADFTFVFVNGEVWEGSTSGGDYEIPLWRFVDHYGSEDAIPFDPDGLKLHVSCSESYPGGWADHNPFPIEGTHGDWQIAAYSISRTLGGGQIRTCGETFVPGTITVVKESNPETDDVFSFRLEGEAFPLPGTQDAIPFGPDDQLVAGDGDSYTWTLDGGEYTLSELAGPGGYSLAGVDCVATGPSAFVVNGDLSVDIHLVGATSVTCTFTNEAPASTTSSTTTTTTAPTTTTSTTTTTTAPTTTTSTTTTTTTAPTTTTSTTTTTTTAPTTTTSPPTGAIGDRVWDDIDGDGIQDEGEPGVDGVTVWLIVDGFVVETTSTTDGGFYLFSGLEPDLPYAVCFDLPVGWLFTTPNVGSDDTVDSDADAEGCTGSIDLGQGEVDRTWDAGFVVAVAPTTTTTTTLPPTTTTTAPTTTIAPPPTGAIGDFVWDDLDSDGIQDAGEPGVAGVTVELLSGGAVVDTTTTGADGTYLFDGLAEGTYEVRFVAPAGYVFTAFNQGSDDAADSDANPANGRTGAFDLAAGELDRTWDAGVTLEVLPTTIVAQTSPTTTVASTTVETLPFTGTDDLAVGGLGLALLGLGVLAVAAARRDEEDAADHLTVGFISRI